MDGNERRESIVKYLQESKKPVSGNALANKFDVSRQVIVQDIALLRAEGQKITSTNTGYILDEPLAEVSRVFKVQHSEEEVEEELKLIVDYGGEVRDVFIYHKVYGTVRAELGIKSRNDIERFMDDIRTGKSSLLMNATSGYHYHTVVAPTEALLDLIQDKLNERGFLAKLRDYEPVDFWKSKE
ncbi:MAG: transcription repressor NadR [Lachnospiraceae bacterium]|nr:transcription repressor NadR [Lachnospiraceae bacterium]MBR1847951.1 transcription repressor NadR [Lachnospiraceae bacterium]